MKEYSYEFCKHLENKSPGYKVISDNEIWVKMADSDSNHIYGDYFNISTGHFKHVSHLFPLKVLEPFKCSCGWVYKDIMTGFTCPECGTEYRP